MTTAELQAELTQYIETRDRILSAGQASEFDGVGRTEAQLAYLDKKITELRNRIAMMANGTLTHNVAVFGGRR